MRPIGPVVGERRTMAVHVLLDEQSVGRPATVGHGYRQRISHSSPVLDHERVSLVSKGGLFPSRPHAEYPQAVGEVEHEGAVEGLGSVMDRRSDGDRRPRVRNRNGKLVVQNVLMGTDRVDGVSERILGLKGEEECQHWAKRSPCRRLREVPVPPRLSRLGPRSR